jgi:putative tricarboxylic transport membrane protein
MLMPFTFHLDPAPSIISLLGIAGTPAAAVTVIDGHAMAKKGEAGKAIGWAMFASFCGGVFATTLLVVFSKLFARLATKTVLQRSPCWPLWVCSRLLGCLVLMWPKG